MEQQPGGAPSVGGVVRGAPAGPSRRAVLTGGLLGLAGLGTATYAVSRGALPGVPSLSEPFPPEARIDPVPVGRSALERRRALGPAEHVYEITGRPSPYYVTEQFGIRLDQWLALHRRHVGGDPDELRTYGAWVAGSATSWHSSGEAIDLARLRAGGRDLVSLRHDLWRDAPATELRRRLSTYWRTAAGLHHEFADVLTYLFDDAHANHIHVDLGRFGDERPRFIRRSRAQVQAVQAMCRHVWARTDVEITGSYDEVTNAATADVLAAHGGGELTDSREAWQAFLVATMQHT